MLLEITDLAVEIKGKEILKDVDLYIDKGENHVLLGPNGAGKSTLFKSILGLPNYKITRGEIIYKGQNITDMPTDERISKGLGVTFQNPPSIRGVKLENLLNIISKEEKEEEKELEINELGKTMNFDKSFLERDVNVGFSGGEVKRSELLQLLVQKPDFIMFDEPDSGVDIENVELISKEINKLLENDKKEKSTKAGLLITHLGYILNFVNATHAHVLLNGRIACSGKPNEIIDDVRKQGFGGCATCNQK